MYPYEMVKFFVIILSAMIGFTAMGSPKHKEDNASIIRKLDQFNSEYQSMWWLRETGEWNYSTNMTSKTRVEKDFTVEMFGQWMREWKHWARTVDQEDLSPALIEDLDDIAAGLIIHDRGDARLMAELRAKMIEIFVSANMSLPELNITAQGLGEYSSLMGKIRDPAILKKIWKSWRLQVGEQIRPYFLQSLHLANKAARRNGLHDIGQAWRRELGSADVLKDAKSLWEEVKELYVELHAYAYHKLKDVYSEEHFRTDGAIPVHLLGSLWGENWASLNDILMPYPELPSINVTEIFISNNYSLMDLIEKADEFYVTGGLDPMMPSFWEKSMFVKPNDGRKVDCHGAAYDFGVGYDYRIRMCGEVTEQSFLEAIHEIGHVQYFMAYNHLPMMYREGANSAFHEAVGETMVYAAQSPKCLELMKIVEPSEFSSDAMLNTLMQQALSKFVFLPWALSLETWRYSVMSGATSEDKMNDMWWTLRRQYQGIEPPDEESANLFDAGSKYHVVLSVPYMRYFMGRFLEHQFLKSMCDLNKENVHYCCFISNKTTVERFRNMLAFGASAPWPDVLETLTGKREILAEPLINYYKPLYKWLVDYNRRHNITPLL